jgi:hypothetical protein
VGCVDKYCGYVDNLFLFYRIIHFFLAYLLLNNNVIGEEGLALRLELDINMMEFGNKIVLELEDLIHHAASTLGSWGTISLGRNKSSHEQHIRTKCLSLREDYKDFQAQIRSLEIYNLNKDNDIFRVIDNYSVDELITDFIVGKNINKIIDNAHDICYKLRKLIVYLEEN